MRVPASTLALALLAPIPLGADIKTSRLPAPASTPTPAAALIGRAVAPIALGPPSHSPDRLDFASVWDGESSLQSFSLTTAAKGTVKVEIPAGPFSVAEILELGPPSAGGSKNAGGGAQPMIVQATKGKVSFPEGVPGPWTYGADVGNQVLVRVRFKPKFDFFTMPAGPKAATMRVSGPGAIGSWTLAIPLAGRFNGLRLAPLVVLPEKDILQVSGSGETVEHFVVRLVGTGQDVSGRIVFPSASPGLKTHPYGTITLGGSETKNVTVPLTGTGGHDDTTPLDGTVAFEYTRKGDSRTLQTPPVPFQVTFVPASFSRDLGNGSCNGVTLNRVAGYFYASGDVHMSVDQMGPECHEAHFEFGFPKAGRTLLHTAVPCNSSPQVTVRVEESGPIGLATVNKYWRVDFDGKFNPGPAGSLDRYRALLHAPAVLRCW